MPLLVDEVSEQALLTGASLAGALRNHLRERQWGYELPMPSRDMHSPYYREWNEIENDLLATSLFGGHRGDEDGAQSPLIVDDALSEDKASRFVELRDGVKIDPRTRTAEKRKKYDYQLLQAGTRFHLRFELLLDDKEKENERRKKALALALQALTDGEIRLGARKRRGFGCCRVAEWEIRHYNLREPGGLLAWLKTGLAAPPVVEATPAAASASDIETRLGVTMTATDKTDRREWLEIEADFEIDGSLLVRGGFDENGRAPDVAHLSTQRGNNKHPVLPGTSAAGAIRHRALRIVNTLASKSDEKADEKARAGARKFIDELFGPEMDPPKDKESKKQAGNQNGNNKEKRIEPRASRVVINEELLTGGQPFVQTRIKIDRFTGGTMDAALLEEAPHFGGAVILHLRLRNPEDAEIGLLLLVLRDLWLGDLPLGGASSVGRGRLRGVLAKVRHSRQPEIEMRDEARNGAIQFTGDNAVTRLEAYVSALQRVQWKDVTSD
jgi:CRISPR/Cas system CSM-associated protein Csm3 (group 7 of RAMP superfamily)